MKRTYRRAVKEPGKSNSIKPVDTGMSIGMHAYAAEVVDFSTCFESDWQEPFTGGNVTTGDSEPPGPIFPCVEAFNVGRNFQGYIRSARIVDESSTISHKAVVDNEIADDAGYIVG